MKTELIKRAIESAQNRKYKLSKDLEHNISDLHRKKANGQKEVMQVTIEALEKQVAKKVVYRKELYGSPYHCPICEAEQIKVEFMRADGTEPQEMHSYCWYCGQKIDWSEEYEQTETNNQDS